MFVKMLSQICFARGILKELIVSVAHIRSIFGVLSYAIRIGYLFRVRNIFLSDFCFPFLFAKTFAANSDRYTVVSHDLEKPIRTRYFRIVPEEWQSNIALRAEFYGCKTGKIAFFNCTFFDIYFFLFRPN